MRRRFMVAVLAVLGCAAASVERKPVVEATPARTAAPSFKWSDGSYAPWDEEDFAKLSQQAIDPDHVRTEALSAAIFVATNEIRRREGLPLLTFRAGCRIAAQQYADDMVRLSFFDANHSHPDPALATPKDRMTKAGLRYATAWGENIAIAFALRYKSGDPFYPPSAAGEPFLDVNSNPIPPHTYGSFGEAVVDQWMHSPHHRDNILDRTWTSLGAACAAYREDGFPKLKCVQDFARAGSAGQ